MLATQGQQSLISYKFAFLKRSFFSKKDDFIFAPPLSEKDKGNTEYAVVPPICISLNVAAVIASGLCAFPSSLFGSKFLQQLRHDMLHALGLFLCAIKK